MALGRAAARVLGAGCILVGRDTRVSGPLLQAALAAGMTAEGVGVGDLGVIPTPGAAWVSAADNLPAAVISASHNPFADNGIKFFAAGGRKLDDAQERRLEAELDALLGPARGAAGGRVAGAGVGRIEVLDGGHRYLDALVGLFPEGIEGLSVVVDCAHGAASAYAPAVLRDLGVDVSVLHDEPDGLNINDGCGSTHPESLQRAVVARGADVGLAFDGDADRVLAADAAGAMVDGDQLLAVLAADRRERRLLADDTVVLTVMANLGLRQALAGLGIRWVETAVGDRSVLEALEAGAWSLGGEQSGHLILRDLATTGDGILTGLALLDVVRRSGRPLADLAAVMTRLPQVLRNVALPEGRLLNGAEPWASALADVQASLGSSGRVLVRPSGTEPVVRVMVEAPSLAEADAACGVLCDAITAAVG